MQPAQIVLVDTQNELAILRIKKHIWWSYV